MSKSLILLVATLVLGTAATATEVETTTGPLAVTPVGSSTQYNTTGIQIGNYLYLYHQGGASGTACPAIPGDPAPSTGDQVIAYRALLTNGVPGSFTLIGRISPCVKAPVCTPLAPHWDCVNTFPPVSLGPGQIFRATINGVTKYHLLADASDTLTFRNVWRAESSDGLNWTWYISGALNGNKTETLGGSFPRTIQSVWSSRSFMSTDGSVPGYGVFGLLNPILLSTGASTNNSEWWGFFNFWNGASRVGALRITWSGTPSQPTVRVLTSISPSWTYTSVTNGAIDHVTPVELYTANVKSLVAEGGGHQLWGGLPLGSYGQYVSCDINNVATCGYAGGCVTGDGSTVPYGQSGRPFWLNTGPTGDVTCPTCSGSGFAWWPVTRFSFGGLNVVYSRVRNLPSGYEFARGFPFRWNSPGGQRYLFSATNDAHICSEFLFSPFWKMYVVRTQLTNEP